MPRLFISHSSQDNIQALAVQRWLETKGWSKDDVFIDLHDMKAGESWRETLVKANRMCAALLYLASPEALDSEECRREVRRAEDDRKDVIVAILRDVTLDDERLTPYKDQQIMDLSAKPLEERVEVEHESQRHLIDFNRAALNAIHATLIEKGIAPGSFAWPPANAPDALPYPGLDAFDESAAGIFFGREADIMGGIRDLRQIRHRGSPRLLVIQAASGAGKSSFLRAGLWPRLKRTAEFAPLSIVRPATGIISGEYGLGQGLSAWFAEHGHPRAAGVIHGELAKGDEAAAAAQLAAYMTEAIKILREERSLEVSSNGSMAEPKRLSPLIAIDQGEELFAADDAAESNRFLAMLGHLLSSPPEDLDPFVLITIRADSFNALLQRVPALGIDTPHTVPLPPLSQAAYRDVITKPAAVYACQVQRLDIEPDLINRLVEDASGADALPLLAFTLQRLFVDYAPEQTLKLEHYIAMGGMNAAIARKLKDAQRDAGGAGSDENLRRLIVPGLATWDPEAKAAKRVVADEAQLTGGARAALAPLAKALVEARLLTRSHDTIEVAHEALLRQPPISGWLDAQKDELKLRDDILREAKEWEAGRHAENLVRRGERLQTALGLAASEDFKTALAPARDYLAACEKLEVSVRRRERWRQTAIYTLMLGVIVALLGVVYRDDLEALRFELWEHRRFIAKNITPYVLSEEKERVLKQGDTFRECAEKVCPEMVVVPAGSFQMGSPDDEPGRGNDEGPVREVEIPRAFAVSKFEITWDDWEQCVAMRGCDGAPTSDSGYGRGNKPLINVSWEQAVAYTAWMSRVTGKEYRLLSEAEWEYAARAGSQTIYSFGDDVSQICSYANLADMTSKQQFPNWTVADCADGEAQIAVVGAYRPNAFGLYDMHGNVWEWVQDCHGSYGEAPSDGSAKEQENCSSRVLRGGAWNFNPDDLRSASRSRYRPGGRFNNVGFRLARTLLPHTP